MRNGPSVPELIKWRQWYQLQAAQPVQREHEHEQDERTSGPDQLADALAALQILMWMNTLENSK